MTNKEQLERITRYEAKLDEAERLLASGRICDDLREVISDLGAYYQSPEWMSDFADDEAGLLPRDLKRGVLSEDGIYDLLTAFEELSEE